MTEEFFLQVKEGFRQRFKKKYLWCMEKLQLFGEWVTSTPILSLLVIIFFLPFIVSVGNVFFPESLPEHIAKILPDHIIALLNVKITGPAFGVIFGFLLFAQRLDTMNKQAKTAQDQVNLAQDQVNLAQKQFGLEQKKFDLTQSQHESLQHQIKATERQHRTEQFNRACELLAHEKMVSRLGGITLLGALARTDPETWHVVAVDTLALFIRNRSAEDENSPVRALSKFLETTEENKINKKEADKKWQEFNEAKANEAPADIAEAMRMIACDLTDDQKAVVQKHLDEVRHWPKLRESWLCQIDLTGAYLPWAYLTKSFLCLSMLNIADLTVALLRLSHLDGTFFNRTKFQGTEFNFANVTSADFILTAGLESCELESWYCVENKNPRNLPDKFKPDPRTDKDYRDIIRTYNEKRGKKLFRTLGELKT